MSIQFILGNSGSGKTTFLYKKLVDEAAANPFKNYLVIVPEQFTMRTQQMLVGMSPNKAIMNIDVLSFKRLAYRVFDELGINDIEILEETGKNLVLSKVAKEKESSLSVLRPNINRIGYISEVKSLLSELVQYNITPTALEAYIQSDRISEVLRAKISDVLVMYRGFEEFIQHKYITAEELLNVLGQVAKQSQILKGAVMVFDEFTGFTPIQNELLKTLMPLLEEIYITLTIDSNEDFYHSRGMHELFDMPKKTIKTVMQIADETGCKVLEPIVLEPKSDMRFKDFPELFFMEQNIFRKKHLVSDNACENIKITSVKNPKEEMTYVARLINELVRREGYRYKDIAIVSGDVETYSNYSKDIMSKYEIPYFIDTTKDILFHPFIEFIRAALEVVWRDFSMEAVFRFLRCGFCDIADKDIDILENYVLATGMRGKKAWSKRIDKKPRESVIGDLSEIEELRAKIYQILSPLVESFSKKDSTVKDNIIAIYDMILSLSIEEKLWNKEKEYLDKGEQVKSKEYGQIYKTVMSLFEKYIYILGQDVMPINEFIEILDAGFDAAEVSTIPPGYDCVTIGDIERTRLNNVKILFFVGVNDGIVPKVSNKGGIISQYEREMLREMDIELAPGSREQSFIQKFYLYLNITKPSKRLYLSYHRLDKEGKVAQKSYLINTIDKMFSKLEINHIEDISVLLNVSTKQAAKEYLISGKEDENWYAIANLFDVEKILDARFTYYEGNPISRAVARAIYGKKIEGSVTRLEQFARCQYAHFLKYGLRLRERETSEFKNVDIGNIYHEALLRYSSRLQTNADFDWRNISDDKRDELARLSLAEAIENYPSILAYASSKEEHMLKRMENIFLQTVWALTVQVKKGKFEPQNFEYSFDIVNDDNLSLYGRIDRIDRCNDEGRNYIKIIDYKSGNTSFDVIKLYHGIKLQLAVYLDAAAGDGEIPGGMLYYHIDDPIIELDEGKDVDVKEQTLLKLRPEGLINSDERIIDAFDENLEKKSLVIPVTLKKDGTPDSRSSVASTEDFDVIREYARNKMTELGQEIFDGQIKINPLGAEVSDSCKFCSYQSVCAIKSKIPGLSNRKVDKLSKEAVMDEMRTVNAMIHGKKGD